MKKLGQSFIVGVAVFIPLFAAYLGGYQRGRQSATVVVSYGWEPKIGDIVATEFEEDGTLRNIKHRAVLLTNVVRVGRDRRQTGILVYGDGLPGVDSSWVKPMPLDLRTR